MAKNLLPGADAYVDDCVLPGEPVLSDQESAYKRGYQQGACVALQALKDGASFSSVWTWAQITLRKWRIKDHPLLKGKMISCVRPPHPPAK